MLTLTLALVLGGCVQLIAFDQAIIGQPDVIERSASADVCDREVPMGASAFCDVSCAIDPSDGASTCGARARLDGDAIELDVSGLFEVELVLNACTDSSWSMSDEEGARLTASGRAIELRGREGAMLHRSDAHLPDGECAERSVVLQDRRVELVEADRRVCDEGLLRLPPAGARHWRLTLGRGVRSVEVCMRVPRAPQRS